MKNLSIAIVMLVLAGGACTKKDESVTPDTASKSAVTPKSEQALEKNITIGSVGETMAFDKTELFVKAGDTITLKFVNKATTLAHNWVLVKPGKDDEIGLAGIQAGPEKNYLPNSPDIIKATRLVPPKGQKYADKPSEVSTGESATITFTAPAAGDYPYICTNAGHHTVMKGVLHSK